MTNQVGRKAPRAGKEAPSGFEPLDGSARKTRFSRTISRKGRGGLGRVLGCRAAVVRWLAGDGVEPRPHLPSPSTAEYDTAAQGGMALRCLNNFNWEIA